MDVTRRQITKIAREVSKFTVRVLKQDGIGTAEFDFIHIVRKNPGITQAGVREKLNLDKGAAARRCASLETKGYLLRRPDPNDGRRSMLYATEKAEKLKNSKTSVEATAYQWLTETLPDAERAEFARVLDKLYRRFKEESRAEFPNLSERVREQGDEAE